MGLGKYAGIYNIAIRLLYHIKITAHTYHYNNHNTLLNSRRPYPVYTVMISTTSLRVIYPVPSMMKHIRVNHITQRKIDVYIRYVRYLLGEKGTADWFAMHKPHSTNISA